MYIEMKERVEMRSIIELIASLRIYYVKTYA